MEATYKTKSSESKEGCEEDECDNNGFMEPNIKKYKEI